MRWGGVIRGRGWDGVGWGIDPEIVYAELGWTCFQRSCAELIKPSRAGKAKFMCWMSIDLGQDEANSRQVPLVPEMFAMQLAFKTCTSRGDKATLVKLYAETSLRMLSGLRPDGAIQLALSLCLCQSLRVLSLRRMAMGSAGAAASASAGAASAAGAFFPRASKIQEK